MTPTLIQIAAFIRRNHKGSRYWRRENLLGWLRWLWAMDAIACVTSGNRLVGVGIARPVASLEAGLDYYAVHPLGAILYVDFAGARNRAAVALLLRQATERWGERAMIAFARGRRRKVALPWRRFMRAFQTGESNVK